MLGYFWIFTSISLCIGLYKLEISKRVIDEEYECKCQYKNVQF